MAIFTALTQASQGADTEINIQEQVIYLGHEGNTNSRVGEYDKEEYLIKPTTTVGDWSSVPVRQLYEPKQDTHLGVITSKGQRN